MVKNSSASAGDVRDMHSISGSGREPVGGHSDSLQYSCLQKPTNSLVWQIIVCRFAKSQTQLKQLSTHAQTHETKGMGGGRDKLGVSG